MGYRSDVTIVMYPKNARRISLHSSCMQTRLSPTSSRWLADMQVTNTYCSGLTVSSGTRGTRRLMCTPAPFLSGRIRSEMKQTQKARRSFHYEFMRIGEDYEDVVYDCSYGSAHALNMSREIYIDF
jgi:hypothetical protein